MRACVRAMKLVCKVNVVDVGADGLYNVHISMYFRIVAGY